MPKAFISGCAGLALNDEERAFLRREDPWGLILFKRNIADRDQVRALTHSFRESVGRADAPVLIDQEGGRVQRMAPPHWRSYPAAAAIEAALEPEVEHKGQIHPLVATRSIFHPQQHISQVVEHLQGFRRSGTNTLQNSDGMRIANLAGHTPILKMPPQLH